MHTSTLVFLIKNMLELLSLVRWQDFISLTDVVQILGISIL